MCGIWTDGFSSVAIEENGLPAQYDGDGALGCLNTDQSFRVDQTVARVDAVPGGPSAIFSPSAPGGVVNFIICNGAGGFDDRRRDRTQVVACSSWPA